MSIVLSFIRRAMVASWTLLTIGLATGANWAYVELGWGGYWAWDPVENTVLMPWLMLTAGLHALRDHRLQARFPRTFMALLVAPFPLVAFGAAVTRSGGLSSVHAFADAEALGWTLGLLVVALLGVAGWRVISTRSEAAIAATLTPLRWLMIASVALAIFMTVVVMMGVALPLLPGSNRIVTARFYNRVGAPVSLVALLAMAAMPTQRDHDVLRRATTSLAAAGLVAAAAFALGITDWFLIGVLGLGVVSVVGHVVASLRIPLATVVGHIGFAVLAVGIAGSAQADTVATVLAPGESAAFGDDLTLTYQSFQVTDGPRPRSEAVTVHTTVTRAGADDVLRLAPGLVAYPDRAVVLAETSLHSTPARDVQVLVRTVSDDGLASFEISERPVQMFVWWGTALIALAGPIALTTRFRSANVESKPLIEADLAHARDR